MILNNRFKQIKNFLCTLSGQSRNKNNFCIRNKGQNIPYFFRIFFHRMIVFFDCIPFVDRNNQSTASVVSNSRNFRILLRHAFRGINHQNDHIRALNCCNCANNTVAFNIFLNFTLPSESGSINKHIFCAIVNNFCVNRIPCCSGNIRNNNTIFT